MSSDVEISVVFKCGIFDQAWFVARHPEAARFDGGVVAWYVYKGHMLSPHPLFDVGYYVSETHDWWRTASTPLGHYLLLGAARDASPHPLFDPAWYAAQVPAMAPERLFRHYLTEGFAAGLWPHPGFDPDFYWSQSPELRADRPNPLLHFVETGWAAGLSPNRFFDLPWYAAQHPELTASGVNPYIHFLTCGADLGHRPHPGMPAEPLDRFLRLVAEGKDPPATLPLPSRAAAEGNAP
jgi:hypothetical protein